MEQKPRMHRTLPADWPDSVYMNSSQWGCLDLGSDLLLFDRIEADGGRKGPGAIRTGILSHCEDGAVSIVRLWKDTVST